MYCDEQKLEDSSIWIAGLPSIYTWEFMGLSGYLSVVIMVLLTGGEEESLKTLLRRPDLLEKDTEP